MFKKSMIIACILIAGAMLAPAIMAYDIVDLQPETINTDTRRVYAVSCWGQDVYWSSAAYNSESGLMEDGAIYRNGARIASLGFTSTALDVSEDAVVWTDYSAGYLEGGDYNTEIYYTAGGAASPLTSSVNAESSPRISGRTVVFTEGGNNDLGYIEIGSTSVQRVPDSMFSDCHDISGQNIVYVKSHLYLYNISTLQTTKLVDDVSGHGLAISENNVVYTQRKDFGNDVSIHLYNIETGEHTVVVSTEGSEHVRIDGNFIVWTNHIYDIQARTVKVVGGGMQGWPNTGGSRIAWYSHETPESPYVVMAAPQPQPGQAPIDDAPVLPDDYHWTPVTLAGEGTSRELQVGEGISFTVSGEEHAVGLKEISGVVATLEVFSDPTTVALQLGQTTTVKGLDITLDAVDSATQTVTLTIKEAGESDDLIPGIPFPGGFTLILAVSLLGFAFALYRRKRANL